MTKQITLDEALELVDFGQNSDGTWCVTVVKGACGIVKSTCGIVEGDCGIVKGSCGTVGGCVFGTINGRPWKYGETPREKIMRLLEEGASKEELLKAMEELHD